jgi:hypothetical protein
MRQPQKIQEFSWKYYFHGDRFMLSILGKLSGDPVNSGHCKVTPATYTQATIEQPGYATRF